MDANLATTSSAVALDEAIALTAGDVAAQRRALDLFIELGATADADRQPAATAAVDGECQYEPHRAGRARVARLHASVS